MTAWWQHLPEHIDPIAFTVGFFSVHWYALLWLLGLLSAWYIGKKYRTRFSPKLSDEEYENLVLIVFVGALLGGHLGYGLLYQPEFFLRHPVQFFFPYDIATGIWTGIRGMSFYGGLVGVSLALCWYAKRWQKNFSLLADLIALAAPVALFFGRLGNFLNQELPGRLAEVPWGMYFPGVSPLGSLRHPSTLYEALTEGVLLFSLLLFASRKTSQPGQLTALFLIGYGTFRFFLEYFRELDLGTDFIFGYFTFGQILSLITALSGALFLLWLQKKRRVTIVV
jgi:phosphatidylglycerol:prolipoprotein diacylglycerol transferase